MEKLIKSTPDVKKAVKVAEQLRKDTTDCIICRKIEFNMSRYFETVAGRATFVDIVDRT